MPISFLGRILTKIHRMIKSCLEWMKSKQHKSWGTVRHREQSPEISVISGSRGPRVGRELLSQTLRRHWLNIVHSRDLLRGRDMGCCHNWPDDAGDDMRLSWPVSLQLASEFVSKGDEVIFTFYNTSCDNTIKYISWEGRPSVVKTWQSVPSEMTWDNEGWLWVEEHSGHYKVISVQGSRVLEIVSEREKAQMRKTWE